MIISYSNRITLLVKYITIQKVGQFVFFEFTENDKLFAKSSAYLEVIYEK